MQSQYHSVLLEKAVGEFSKLPGVGRKTALRLVLHLLRQSEEEVAQFTEAVATLRRDIKYCRVCHNISDTDVCPICADSRRDVRTVCVVENVQDVMAIENTQQYRGLYHVLGGVISPMDGISLTNTITPDGLGRDEAERITNLVGILDAGNGHGLYHANINVLRKEQLEDAVEHPEKYPHLTVRVSGYAVNFVKLTKEQQLDVISRTFHQGAVVD